MQKNMIIGIHAKKQSGKTTVANYLFREHEFDKLSFAEPLYTMFQSMCDAYDDYIVFSNEKSTYDWMKENKEVVHPELGFSLRKALQTLGTEWGRNMMDADLWTKILRRRLEIRHQELSVLNITYRIVIDDVRFENEYEVLKEFGESKGIPTKLVVLTRDTEIAKKDGHASESGLSESYLKKHNAITIRNKSTLEDLFTSVRKQVLGLSE